MRSHLARLAPLGLFVLALVALAQGALAAYIHQGPPAVTAPEIDGSSLSAGLGLLSAGALIIRSRMRSK